MRVYCNRGVNKYVYIVVHIEGTYSNREYIVIEG